MKSTLVGQTLYIEVLINILSQLGVMLHKKAALVIPKIAAKALLVCWQAFSFRGYSNEIILKISNKLTESGIQNSGLNAACKEMGMC